MGDEFHAAIKLVSGEEIFSLISIDENEGDPIILLQNPVIMDIMENPHGIYVKIRPWMEIPEDDMFIVKLDKIITMSEISDKKTIGFYERYLKEEDNSSYQPNEPNRVNISNKMGYVSTVEEARKMLETLYKLKDNKES